MDVKVALLVISALFSAATAFPYDLLAKASASDLDCNNNAIHYTSIGYRNYALKGCTTRRGALCIDGLPTTRCSYYITPSQCYHFYWYSGKFSWSAIICQQPFASGHCYKTGSISNCKDVWAQQEEEPADEPVNGVQICEYVDGEKQCRTLSEGLNAEAMQEPDCFCVKDFKENKACVPDDCDAGRRVPLMQELIDQQQQAN